MSPLFINSILQEKWEGINLENKNYTELIQNKE